MPGTEGNAPRAREAAPVTGYRSAAIICILSPLLTGQAIADRTAEIARGEALYIANCRECHGPTGAEGEVGDIRGLPARVLQHATQAGIGMMPRIALAREDVAAIAAYLAQSRE